MQSQIMESRELERLLSAATVSETFRQLLIADPVKAFMEGYQGERFQLDAKLHSRLKSMRVASLPELAQQLLVVEQEMVAAD